MSILVLFSSDNNDYVSACLHFSSCFHVKKMSTDVENRYVDIRPHYFQVKTVQNEHRLTRSYPVPKGLNVVRTSDDLSDPSIVATKKENVILTWT